MTSSSISWTERVDQLDEGLFQQIKTGGTSGGDRRSLLALHAALAARGEFGYMEVGSYQGASLQSVIGDPRCHQIVSIDRRDALSPDERSDAIRYPDNTTAAMLERLSGIPGADLNKLTTIDSSTGDLDPTEVNADLCFIDAEHTNAAVLEDARFCRRALRSRGVIVFHDRTLVGLGICRFLSELAEFRAYPLADELFVVELNVPTLLTDPRVKGQFPHWAWVVADRFGATRVALRLLSSAWHLRRLLGRTRT